MLQCAITDGSAGTRAEWLVGRCAKLQVDLLIVRERELAAAALVSFAREVVAVAGGVRVLVAGEAGVALAAGAAGVHLSATRGSVAEVRGVMTEAYVTRSCHTVAEVVRAREEGVDAVLFGPVFGKWVGGVEVVAGVGVARLREACEAAEGMTVYGVGGMTLGNAVAGAGMAGIRMYFGEQETA